MKRLMKSLVMLMTALSFALGNTCIISAKPSKPVKVKLNVTKKTVDINKSFTLRLKNNKQKVNWYASNKKVRLSKKKKTSVLVTGKKKGTSTVTAKIGKRKYKCKVTIKAKKSKPKKAKKKSTPKAPSEQDDSAESEVKTPEDKYNAVKVYIEKNGDINDTGNKFISKEDTDDDGTKETFGIVSENDKLEFIMSSEDDELESTVSMEYWYPDIDASVEMMVSSLISTEEFKASAELDPNSFNGNDEIYWKRDDGVMSSEETNYSTASLKLGMASWNVLMLETTGYSLQDIGFTNYE